VVDFYCFKAQQRDLKALFMTRAASPDAALRLRREYGKKLPDLFCLLSYQRVAISGELLHVKNS
jgi:hypothetical protein